MCQKGGLSGVMLLSLALCQADTVSVTCRGRRSGDEQKKDHLLHGLVFFFFHTGLYSYSSACAESDRT